MKLVYDWTSIKGHPVSGVSTVRDAYFQTETHDRFGEWDHEIQKNLECGEYGAGGGGGAVGGAAGRGPAVRIAGVHRAVRLHGTRLSCWLPHIISYPPPGCV